jgi:hypothetical protein
MIRNGIPQFCEFLDVSRVVPGGADDGATNPRRLRGLDLPAFGLRKARAHTFAKNSALPGGPSGFDPERTWRILATFAGARVNASSGKSMSLPNAPRFRAGTSICSTRAEAAWLFLGARNATDVLARKHPYASAWVRSILPLKCPSSELAGFRRTSSRPRPPQDRDDEHASMAVEFCHIFSCVAAWRAKDDRHTLIQLALPIAKAAKV